jgi:hypothetical protein
MRCIDAVPSRGPILRRSPGLRTLDHSATLLDPSAAVRPHCVFTPPILTRCGTLSRRWLGLPAEYYHCCPLIADNLHGLRSLRFMRRPATVIPPLRGGRAVPRHPAVRQYAFPRSFTAELSLRQWPVQRVCVAKFAHCSGASLCRVPSPCRTTLARTRSAVMRPHCAARPLRYVPRRCSAEAYIIPPSSTSHVHRFRLRWISSQSSPTSL